MDDLDDVNAKFKRNFVATLHSLSPALAATHVTRMRREGLAVPSPLHCSYCGHPAVASRVVAAQRPRSKNRTSRSSKRENKDKDRVAPSKRGPSISKVCSLCGFSERTLLAVPASASTCPAETASENRTTATQTPNDDQNHDDEHQSKEQSKIKTQENGSRQSTPSLTASRQPQNTSKKLKKSGLQEMLARSKAKKHQTDPTGDGQNSLAAFLSGL